MRRVALLIALALSACTAGCTVGPTYRPPASSAGESPQLRESDLAQITPSPLPLRWWRLFDTPALDRLVERALVNNTDLRQAAANLQRARGALSEARAARLPTGTASVEYQRERIGLGTAGLSVGAAGAAAGAPAAINTDYYRTGYDASYELDLFGGVRRSVEAARADIETAQAQVDASRVSVAAETARAFAQACGYAAQAAVARETVALEGRTLDLTQRLFTGGRGTRRDVAQIQVLVEQANAALPTYEAERRSSLYALAVLTGLPPEQVDTDADRCATPPSVAQPIPIGDGQMLLARRPDVRVAERRLAGDVARVGVATAALYPRVQLLGSISLAALTPGDLGAPKSLSGSIGPSISWSFPFNGAVRARIRQARATATGDLATFDGAVLTALRETEQALARLNGAVGREAALERAAAASEEAARISRIRFQAGSDNSLQLIDAERARADTRAQLAQAQADRADAQVSLFKALGGGWEDAPTVVDKRPF